MVYSVFSFLMKPLLPNPFIINNKHLSSILSPSTDIIDYNYDSDGLHKLNLLQILRPDIYFGKNYLIKNFLSLKKILSTIN